MCEAYEVGWDFTFPREQKSQESPSPKFAASHSGKALLIKQFCCSHLNFPCIKFYTLFAPHLLLHYINPYFMIMNKRLKITIMCSCDIIFSKLVQGLCTSLYCVHYFLYVHYWHIWKQLINFIVYHLVWIFLLTLFSFMNLSGKTIYSIDIFVMCSFRKVFCFRFAFAGPFPL